MCKRNLYPVNMRSAWLPLTASSVHRKPAVLHSVILQASDSKLLTNPLRLFIYLPNSVSGKLFDIEHVFIRCTGLSERSFLNWNKMLTPGAGLCVFHERNRDVELTSKNWLHLESLPTVLFYRPRLILHPLLTTLNAVALNSNWEFSSTCGSLMWMSEWML